MISRYQQKKQAVEKLEDVLTQVWNISLLMWSHEARNMVIHAWNTLFDVKEILQAELEKEKQKGGFKDERHI